jgi:hypothetical protein
MPEDSPVLNTLDIGEITKDLFLLPFAWLFMFLGA